MRRLLILLLLGCATWAVSAGEPVPAQRGGAPVQANPADTLQQIQSLIGSAACNDHAQCQVLPVGARACGGPQSYLAWSSAHTDRGALEVLGERYKAERLAQIAARGEMSDCRVIAEPKAVCQAGTCQLTSNLPLR